MAVDQNFIQEDLRPLNVARIITEEPQIADVVAATNNTRGGAIPVLYPATVTDAGFASLGYGNVVPLTPGVPAWRPRMPMPVPVGNSSMNLVGEFGYSLNLGNMVAANAVHQVSNDVVAGHGYSPSLGNRINGNRSDQLSNDRVTVGLGHSCNMGNRVSGNGNELIGGVGYKSNSGVGSNGNGADQVNDEGGDDSVSGKKVLGGRYCLGQVIGGQTMIISVRRYMSFNEFVKKMMDTYGQPVVIKYQLLDEDLDALVSVSCSDDLVNMMDEYEKVIERSLDGSAKLRVFLFSASKLDPFGTVQFGDLHVNGQKYVEAINGIVNGAAGGTARKESIASATSTPNSDISGSEAVDSSGAVQGDVGGPPSTNLLSPRGNSPIFGVHLGSPVVNIGPQTLSSQLEFESGRTVRLASTQQQLGYDLQQHYASTHVDPCHEVTSHTEYMQFAPQMEFSNPKFVGNTGSVFNQQPAPFQLLLQHQQTPLEYYPDQNAFGTRIIQHPVYQSHKIYQAEIPSAMVAGGYTFHHTPQTRHVVFSDGSLQQIKYRGLLICQKALPHVHFDPLVQDQRDGGTTPMVNADSSYHGLHQEDSIRISSVNKVVVTAPIGDDIAHQQAGVRQLGHVDNQVGGLKLKAFRSSQNLDAPYGHEGNISSITDNSNHPRIPASLGLMGLASEFQSPYVLPTQYQFQKEVPHVEAIGIPALEQPVHEMSRVPAVPKKDSVDPNHLIQIYRMMEPLQMSNEQNSLPIDKIRKEAILDEKYPHIAGKELLLDNLVTHAHPKVGVEVQYGNPPFSGVESAHTLGFDEVSLMQQKIVQCNTEAVPSNANSQAYFSPSNIGGDVLDSSNSLFSNQDPWNLQQHAYFPPPKPNKIQTKKELLALREDRDPFGENQAVIGGESNIELEDKVYQPLSHLNENLSSDHIQSMKGLGEELIKEELQVVAEGVAASVFRSSTHSNPDVPAETNASGDEGYQDTDVLPSGLQHKAKFEELKTKQPDRTNFGLRVSDGIGGLQVIKDSDLEELWELGSGTFGTVYHGKWRGTDVVIKRINDRRFAGKPSEQERMIEDFWNEAIKLADLHHPNVVAFYGVVLDGPGGSVATVMEYMVSGSLRDALQKSERNLDKCKRLLIAMDVAFGMEYLHGKNIILTAQYARFVLRPEFHFLFHILSPTLVLIFSKFHSELIQLFGSHMPSFRYQVGDLGLSKMAPELLNGSNSLVSEKVDVFSFGIVMWELLTREEPYTDLHYGAIIGKLPLFIDVNHEFLSFLYPTIIVSGGIVSNSLRLAVPESCDPDWRSLMERCWSSKP
ncbi:hypothetical protein CXB51_015125 [Gossypium anomalum]|uniref:Protein kinase domain-containing protein n=1 Tax=Gossypium anomalum TaxID=47600 RepID=A0A8J5ZM09_9ROSI|nr:hypothetical protein CXB51_015125 [Gossypium anomalum]